MNESKKELNISYSVPIIIEQVTEDTATGSVEKNEFVIQGVAINSTTTDNNHKFIPEELKLAVSSLINKPLLKDHNALIDNIVGRVIKAEYDEEMQNIQFKAKINSTPQGMAMRELIKSGDLNTVSVGANVTSLMEEDGVLVPRGIKFKELSLVATPADDNATFSFKGSFMSALTEAYNNQIEIVEAEFKCKACDKVFESKEMLTKHYEEKHPNYNSQSSDLIGNSKINERGIDMEKDETIKTSENVEVATEEAKTEVSETESRLNALEQKVNGQTEVLAQILSEIKSFKEVKVEVPVVAATVEIPVETPIEQKTEATIEVKTEEVKVKEQEAEVEAEKEDEDEEEELDVDEKDNGYRVVQGYRSFTFVRNKYK